MKKIVTILATTAFLTLAYNLTAPQKAAQKNLTELLIDTVNYSNKPKVYGTYQKTLGTTFFDFYRLVYSDKKDISNPAGFKTIGPKTDEEIRKGTLLRDSLENQYDALFAESDFLMTENTHWSKLIDGNQIIPKKTFNKYYHAALDIFTEEGNPVLTPFNGIIVASGDKWEGTFKKRKISTWNKKGLTPRAGNAIILYNPSEKGYLLLSHLQEGLLVKTGDAISQGTILGYVGHSGSASIKGHGKHVHAAYKTGKDLKGINFRKRID